MRVDRSLAMGRSGTNQAEPPEHAADWTHPVGRVHYRLGITRISDCMLPPDRASRHLQPALRHVAVHTPLPPPDSATPPLPLRQHPQAVRLTSAPQCTMELPSGRLELGSAPDRNALEIHRHHGPFGLRFLGRSASEPPTDLVVCSHAWTHTPLPPPDSATPPLPLRQHPQAVRLTSAPQCTMELPSGRLELGSAPDRNALEIHRHHGPFGLRFLGRSASEPPTDSPVVRVCHRGSGQFYVMSRTVCVCVCVCVCARSQ